MTDIGLSGLPRPTVGREGVARVGARQLHLPPNEQAQFAGETIPMRHAELYRRENSNDQIRNLVQPRIDDPSILLPSSFGAALASIKDKIAEIAGPDHDVTKIIGELAAPKERLDGKRYETVFG